eukprot:TRINITY_DN3140_c0_g3_i1.p1 TRINITY_DN3140_c0_g3~~TRINITY_DN3140_c0_g3_i1.p1  ORF type:complete len:250 (+),score=51.50 TRINITY_DN3140_c0_g3_i1:34-750(+)
MAATDDHDHSGFNLPDDPVVDFWARPDIVDSPCAQLRSQGCEHFAAYRIDEACKSFDEAAKVCPECGPFLWQRGIARYYGGDFHGAATQFALGQTVNSADTEEVIWEMLSRSKAGQCDWASVPERNLLIDSLNSIKEPRPVMCIVQGLFADRHDVTTLIETLKADLEVLFDLAPEVKSDTGGIDSRDLFYLWFYVALKHDLAGNFDESLAAADSALKTGYDDNDYMVKVAKNHLRQKK